ncbi:coiled-coil domain-containing protein 137 [Chelonus insularis]|uniref:coiled-coil domain-containing protein 137 n=1 Tax=Chelonus insularis TaxID=460826 RepID=UPI00158C1CB1|nr:coiled-coil domain-containing protein 137 [Chelonus insularis]XP_034939097.1 coiled-coil domain-containing protein 137 [Chelonus insularis]
MGRKIPGKKHRGIKDREKQHAERWAQLSTKINAPPKNIDDQEIPKSLEKLIKLKNEVKTGKISEVKKKKKNKGTNKLITLGPQKSTKLDPNYKPEKVVPLFNQKPGESMYVFWNRVNRETQNFLSESTFENKYDVQVKRNIETGEIEGLEKRPKDEIDELAKLKMKHKNIGKRKKKKKLEEPKLTKVEKRKLKLQLKKEKKLEEKVDELDKKETIKFGEVVHEPPNLKVKPVKADKLIKPAQKNLLLNSLFKHKNTDTSKSKSLPLDKTVKRKKLPSAERRMLESQQTSVIEAYKLMKAQQTQYKYKII